MRFSVLTSGATPKRMQYRTYVFAVSALAAFLTIVAFVKPDVSSAVSQATITVPQDGSQVALDPIMERLRSMDFLRKAGQRHGITDGGTSSQGAATVEDWARGVQAGLEIVAKNSAAADGMDVVLKYHGLDGKHSIAVMESLLTTLKDEYSDVESLVSTPAAESRKTLAGQQLERAKLARQSFVDEELARRRQEHRLGNEGQIPVSIQRELDSAHDSSAIHTPLAAPATEDVNEADVELSEPRDTDNSTSPDDWLAEQRRVDAGNHLVRNPEYDQFVRALVRAQTERQELLTQFSSSHLAVRRIEAEIGKLELLVSHTEKYLQAEASATDESSVDEMLALRTDEELTSFDESAAISSIHQSETYQSLDREVHRAEQELAEITRTVPVSHRQPFVVSQPPDLLNRALVGITRAKLLTIGAISTLLGFVVSRLGDAAAVPTVFYSIADVHRSLRIPVVGQLAMDNTPVVPHPESITRGRFWQQFVRAGEFAAVTFFCGFIFALFLRPEILEVFFSNPITAYAHALYELRRFVPVPYLFQ